MAAPASPFLFFPGSSAAPGNDLDWEETLHPVSGQRVSVCFGQLFRGAGVAASMSDRLADAMSGVPLDELGTERKLFLVSFRRLVRAAASGVTEQTGPELVVLTNVASSLLAGTDCFLFRFWSHACPRGENGETALFFCRNSTLFVDIFFFNFVI